MASLCRLDLGGAIWNLCIWVGIKSKADNVGRYRLLMRQYVAILFILQQLLRRELRCRQQILQQLLQLLLQP